MKDNPAWAPHVLKDLRNVFEQELPETCSSYWKNSTGERRLDHAGACLLTQMGAFLRVTRGYS